MVQRRPRYGRPFDPGCLPDGRVRAGVSPLMSGNQIFRLPAGGCVDRTQPVSFTFEGRQLSGYAGDTLASALLANGVRLVGRSFKYHRPRGILGSGAEEPNALVQTGEGAHSTPNVRATEIQLFEGLIASPVNCWPSSRFDVGALNDRFSRFLAAGFYYKTFMWPNWHLFEGFIRKAAGLGRPSNQPDPDRYESRYHHCDVLIVGSGPAGIAAARAAAAGGARVVLAEQAALPGGSLVGSAALVGGREGGAWAADEISELRARDDVRVLTRTAALGYHDHNALTLVEECGGAPHAGDPSSRPRLRTWHVRAKRVILATGAIERPLVFCGNDRPGVMLAGAVRHYIERFAVRPGKRMVLFTNNDEAYRAALAFADTGGQVAAVVDVRRVVSEDLRSALRDRAIELVAGGTVTETSGRHALKAVRVSGGQTQNRWMDTDLLAMSGGYNPDVHLFSQSGGRLRFDEALAAFVPAQSVQAEISVGMAAGETTLAGALAQGHAAGVDAALAAGFPAEVAAPQCGAERTPAPLEPCWRVPGKGKAFVDFQNDVTDADIELAQRENFVSVEHLKRYTTLGMAPDQGKTSNVNALAIMASLTGRSVGETGTTRFRFPFVPAALGSFAGLDRGDLFRPLRRMPAHECHVRAGATFEEYGGWLRPAYYAAPGETAFDAEQREAAAVRAAAGLFEGSPLGKIEVKGSDAGAFLDLVYANSMSTLKVNKVRYGLMLNEEGVIIDDGVAVRLADDHFLVSTTSTGAERIAAWMEEWLQCEWPHLDVIIAPVTTAWGVLTITGPSAREILLALGTDIDLAPANFPHMSFAAGTIGGLPVRLMRVSFTGEVSFEISVPAGRTGILWDMLMDKGQKAGLVPVGIDAWMVLRTEKGYMHVGVDTDGTSTASDVGWGHVLKKKNEFIGKRSMLRARDRAKDRLQFVGFAVEAGEPPLPVGAHAAGRDGSEGHVTSSCHSPVLGKGVALGLLKGGRARAGERLVFQTPGGARHAIVCEPAAFDPGGEKLNG
ncbi:sarcosine oxidase subunit alpha family protein [Sphingopyxis terrae]|uniref:sarcosine oxidase subunit alpha family protein n=1 Tax=Sphingopyxis terrae TaxID=33052 RepID=UPI002A124384|nr:sarcosine oxidase subunit alpha family protein [Sphingopyxis terrae]MDX8356508.1 sarcosine oxidase subunit alpha family protein [Sphingopyxis terrae]